MLWSWRALDAILAGGNNAEALLAALTPAQRTAAVDAAAQAYVHGFAVSMTVVSAVLAVAAVAAWWLLRPRPTQS